MPRPHPLSAILAGAFALLCLAAGDAAARDQPVPPNEDGRYLCVIRDEGPDDGSGTIFEPGIVTNRCCYEEDQGNGETLTVCLKCDLHWKNCEETLDSGRIRSRFDRILTAPTVDGVWQTEPTDRRGTTGGAVLKRN